MLPLTSTAPPLQVALIITLPTSRESELIFAGAICVGFVLPRLEGARKGFASTDDGVGLDGSSSNDRASSSSRTKSQGNKTHGTNNIVPIETDCTVKEAVEDAMGGVQKFKGGRWDAPWSRILVGSSYLKIDKAMDHSFRVAGALTCNLLEDLQ